MRTSSKFLTALAAASTLLLASCGSSDSSSSPSVPRTKNNALEKKDKNKKDDGKDEDSNCGEAENHDAGGYTYTPISNKLADDNNCEPTTTTTVRATTTTTVALLPPPQCEPQQQPPLLPPQQLPMDPQQLRQQRLSKKLYQRKLKSHLILKQPPWSAIQIV